MSFIVALKLIELCVKNDILHTTDGGNILIYHGAGTSPEFPEGWYEDTQEEVAQSLMRDKEGQQLLIHALSEKGVDFSEAEQKVSRSLQMFDALCAVFETKEKEDFKNMKQQQYQNESAFKTRFTGNRDVCDEADNPGP